MSDDPELERRLDAMFGSLRPRAEFADSLRTRLRPRRPWWNQPALLWLAAVIPLLILAVFAVPQLQRQSGGGASTSFHSTSRPQSAAGAALARPPCPSPGALAASQTGKEPQLQADTPSPTPCP